MTKEEILEKSRGENKDCDIFEKEVLKEAGNVGAGVAAAVSSIFVALQFILGKGFNYSLYAIVFSVLAATFIVKAVRLKRKHEIALAFLYSAAAVGFSCAHIYRLVAASGIL